MSVNFLKTNSGVLSVWFSGNMMTVGSDHPNYNAILGKCREQDENGLENLFNIAKAITVYTFGKVEVRDGQVFYGSHELKNSLVDRIIKGMSDGTDYERFVKFLDKLLENPSNRSLEQLYNFLEHTSLTIADDGDFYAYKGIKDDWTDCHTGTVKNDVGLTPSMPRNMISDDPNHACHQGLHVGTFGFANDFGSRTVRVKINPKNVVSVPYDASCQKCRVCEYFVEAEVDRATMEDKVRAAVMQSTDYDDAPTY